MNLAALTGTSHNSVHFVSVLALLGVFPTYGWGGFVPGVLQYPVVVSVISRVMTSIRQLYASDLNGRRGSNINTPFALSALSQPDRAADGSAIVFPEVQQNDRSEEDIDIAEGERNQRSGGGEEC